MDRQGTGLLLLGHLLRIYGLEVEPPGLVSRLHQVLPSVAAADMAEHEVERHIRQLLGGPTATEVAVIAAKPHLDDAFRADRVRLHVRRLKGIAHLVERQQVVGLPNVFWNAEIPEEIELLKVDAGDGLAIPKEPTVSQ